MHFNVFIFKKSTLTESQNIQRRKSKNIVYVSKSPCFSLLIHLRFTDTDKNNNFFPHCFFLSFILLVLCIEKPVTALTLILYKTAFVAFQPFCSTQNKVPSCHKRTLKYYYTLHAWSSCPFPPLFPWILYNTYWGATQHNSKNKKNAKKKLYVNHDLSQVLQGLKINIFEKNFDQEHLHFFSILALCEPLA